MKEKGILETPLGDIRVAEGEDLRTPGNGYTNRTPSVHHDVKLDVRPKRRKTTDVHHDVKLDVRPKRRKTTVVREDVKLR